MDKIKVAFVGIGLVSERHFNAMQQCEQIEVVGAYKGPKRPDLLKKQCDKWGIKPYETYEEVLNDSQVDAVAILSPSNLHAQQVLEAVEAGKQVFVEKPVALSCEDIDRMIEATERTGCIIFPAHNHVYRPVVKKAKEIISSGKLGTISYVSFRCVSLMTDEIAEGWRKDLNIAGGGAMIDSGTHLVYQSVYLMGRPEKLQAFKTRRHCLALEGEDICQISVYYSNGVIGNIMQSWASNDAESTEIRVQGDKGNIKITDALYYNREKIEDDASIPNSSNHQVRAFADAVLEGKPPLSTLKEAKTSLDIILKAYASAESDNVIIL